MSVVKKPVLWVLILSFAIILLSAWILFSAVAAPSREIGHQYRSAAYPDGSTYTAEFHDDQFHIQWNWESRRETILSGLFEPVDKDNGIYLLHDSERNFMEVITLKANGFYLIDRELNDMLIFFQPES